MGTDIYGSVEVRKFDSGLDDWFSVIDAGEILDRDYDLFGCLFGVNNYANFRPLFDSRGEPPDCCEDTMAGYDSTEFRNLTWCTYRELLAIDLSVLSQQPDSRVPSVFQLPDGRILKSKRTPLASEEVGMGEYISRKEALDKSQFKLLMELMGVLSKTYGPDAVRLVVWFDNG